MNYQELLKTFLGFAFFSGLGWLCDFATYAALVEVVGTSPFSANFVSSYVGVTFVYFTSLRLVFNRVAGNHTLFLSLYWGFQFISILAYSAFLNVVVASVEAQSIIPAIIAFSSIAGKIIITPINLLTNFVFMKFLTRFMKEKEVENHHV